jgi:hypothetical protein
MALRHTPIACKGPTNPLVPDSLASPGARGIAAIMVPFVTALRSACLAFGSLWLLLVRTPRPDAVLVQNPPTIPTLLIAWIAARTRGLLLIVD